MKSEKVSKIEKDGSETSDSGKAEDGKSKTGKGIKNLLIILAIPLLTAALSNSLTADSAIAPPDEKQDRISPQQDVEFKLTPYNGAKKGACKMTGYNFAPFKINGNTNVSFAFIKYDCNSSLSLRSEYSGEETVYQDGGAVAVAEYNYDDVTKDMLHWNEGVAGYMDVSKQSETVVATPKGVQLVKNDKTLYFAMPSGGEVGWSGAELYYNSTASLKNAVFIPMEYTGENAIAKPIKIESFKPTTLKIYSVTLNDEQIKAIDSAALVGFRNTDGNGRTGTDVKISINKAPDKPVGKYLTEAVPIKNLFGKTFFIDTTNNKTAPEKAYRGHWEVGNVYINKLSEMTEYTGSYRLTGSADRGKPVMVFSNFTGKPYTFNVEADNVNLTTAEGISPFIVKGNGPVTINIIGSGTSDFEANGTGIFYAASNIKITVSVFKVDSKSNVIMKNSATHLQAVSCGPYSSKVTSSVKTEPADFYSYTGGSITKKEDGTFNLSGGSVFMNTEGVTQTHRNLYWYYEGASVQGSFDPAYMAKTEPAVKYSSLLTLKGSLTKDSLLLIDTGDKKSAESEFSVLLSAVSFTSTTKSSPVIVTGKNDVVINLFYSGKNTLTYSKDVPMVDIRTDDIINVRVNLIKTDDKAQIKNSGQAAAGFNSALPHDGLDAKKNQ